MPLHLSCALTENGRTEPILRGNVTPEGVTLNAIGLHPSELFYRQLHGREFDVSEMSISSLTIANAHGQTDWVGIPIFTSRRFFHTGVMIRTDRGITKPGDLAGKRVGVPEYQQTAALWTRGALRDEFGLQPSWMEWFMERSPEMSHGSATGFAPPENVRISHLLPEQDLGQMFADGEIDALIHYSRAQNLVDRSSIDPLADPHGALLFDPPQAEARRYFDKTGIHPMNHCVVMRRSIAEANPWVIGSIFDAFERAKTQAAASANAAVDEYPLHYGVRASRSALESITRYVHQDGLTSRVVGLDEIFARETLDL